jgi:hypothetical protein
MGCDQKTFKLVFSAILASGHLPRLSRQLRLSANDKGDNEIIHGAGQSFPDIYLITEENLAKPQLGDRSCDQSSPQLGLLSSR